MKIVCIKVPKCFRPILRWFSRQKEKLSSVKSGETTPKETRKPM